MYPIMLDLCDRRCLVVGGGGVAVGKVEGLLAEGARVTVVAPRAVASLERRARDGVIALHRRAFVDDDLEGFQLVFAATGDHAVNQEVVRAAHARGAWVNVADDPELCDFHLPARVQRGSLQIAVASGGQAPFVSRRLRQLLERKLGLEWSVWIEAAGRFRRAVRAMGLSHDQAEARYHRFFAATVDEDRLKARVPSAEEEASWLCSGQASGAALPHDAPLAERTRPTGFVSLVGAGPGDPRLMTLRGSERVRAADAVVYDALAAGSLPADLPDTVELHCVGKQAGDHPVPQDEINLLLLRLAREGKRVVRLKGGDPFVFGRGSEEAEVLKAAGIPYEVVPGVTAGVAVPACAGIPVTHRGEAVRVTLVTAHTATRASGAEVRWDELARDPHATLVGYMGVSRLAEVAERLVDAGMNPATPAAIIQAGATARQRAVYGTVSDLPGAAQEEKIEPPAIFVIGPTVKHASILDWFTARPLFGERLGLFDAEPELLSALDMAGADLVRAALPVTRATRVAMRAVPLSGWLFETAEQVCALDEDRDGPGFCATAVAWCRTREAARRARELGWRRVEELPQRASVQEIVSAVALARAPAPAPRQRGLSYRRLGTEADCSDSTH
jgi:uroporphyrin-III C-methyltransferase / precorrin-2 dehydrogenase / sirohydrochlorin ferrochelatase